MKKIILLLSFLISLSSFGQHYNLDQSVHENQSLPFISHTGSGAFGSYLTMNINFPPVRDLYNQLRDSFDYKIKNRGEAHITVVTPVEFNQVLKNKVSIKEINAIASDYHIQESQFDVVCIGEGKAHIKGRVERNYFVVVESSDLIQIRKSIQNLYVSRGGNPSDFVAEHFYPHITLGFTKRDLHENDGVTKDRTSCISYLN